MQRGARTYRREAVWPLSNSIYEESRYVHEQWLFGLNVREAVGFCWHAHCGAQLLRHRRRRDVVEHRYRFPPSLALRPARAILVDRRLAATGHDFVRAARVWPTVERCERRRASIRKLELMRLQNARADIFEIDACIDLCERPSTSPQCDANLQTYVSKRSAFASGLSAYLFVSMLENTLHYLFVSLSGSLPLFRPPARPPSLKNLTDSAQWRF